VRRRLEHGEGGADWPVTTVHEFTRCQTCVHFACGVDAFLTRQMSFPSGNGLLILPCTLAGEYLLAPFVASATLDRRNCSAHGRNSVIA
jgi:hypothetical protein